MNERQSMWMLHFVVLIFGFTGILGREITLEAVPLVFWRVVIGGLGVWVWLLLRGKYRRMPPLLAARVAGVGLIAAAHWVTFFHAIKVSNVSVALATLASAPLFVGVIEPLVHRRPVSRRELALGAVMVLGLCVLVDLPGWSGEGGAGSLDPAQRLAGVGYALVSAALAATFSVFNSVLVRNTDAANLARWELTAAALALGGLLWMQSAGGETDVWRVSTRDAGWLLLLGWVATSFAFLMSIEVMRHVRPFTVAVAINMEPVYAILFAALLYREHEQMDAAFYAGAALLVGSVVADAWGRRTRS
jgi:drug/metabolite transporter (DMT)-like permease